MKKIWGVIGRVAYFIVWPAIHFYLRNSYRSRVVVQAEGKILVVKDWLGNNNWKLPGGGIKKGEQLAVGASRELYEETGLQIKPSELKLVGSIDATGHATKVKLYIFKVELPKRAPIKKQKLEIVDIGWQDPNLLLKSGKITRNTQEVLDKFGGFELKP